MSDKKEKIELDPKTAAVFKRKNYKVAHKLAEGAFGKVYKAERLNDGVFAAVKVMDIEKMSDIVREVLVPREMELMTKIRHPNVLSVFDIFRSAGKYYIFMEFAGGGSLNKKCEGAPANPKLAKKWFKQTTDALRYMHDELNICHRDIKLENVLLDADGNAKLSDFGFSRIHEGGLAKTVLGTLPYYSPQLVLGSYDPFKADVWAMGIMLYGLMTAKFAFSNFPRAKKPPKEDVKAWLDAMKDATYKKREEYQVLESSAKEMIDGCLHFNEVKRFTATKMMQHKWLR